MTVPSQTPAVVVIGAGAAGIAAGRELERLRVPFVILEARDRLGGRATTQTIGGYRFDLGCEWLHSGDRNVLAALASDRRVPLDKSPPPWQRRNPQIGFDCNAQEAFDATAEAFFVRLERAADTARGEGQDRPASDFLEPGNVWNGLLDAISTYYNGAPLDRVSVLDFDRYVDTEVNWRVEGGYGAHIAALGAELPVHFGCRVLAVDTSGRRIRVETDAGAVETGAVLVTVPTDVIASSSIGFASALDDHVHAAAGLPLGTADKLYFELADAEAFEADTRLLGALNRRDTGSYTLRAGGRPLVEGYFGGDYAKHLEKGGLPAFADAAMREIASGLGHDIASRLKPLVATAWAADPFSRGSYSHALPGHAAARAVLAEPFQERLQFAGEATSPHFFSTAHGAWEEGQRAANALVRARGLMEVAC